MITLNYIIVYKLLVLDKNTWNYTTAYKFLDRNTWYHISYLQTPLHKSDVKQSQFFSWV